MYDTILRNVKVLEGTTWKDCDVGIKDACFADIAPQLSGAVQNEVDGLGHYCLPGAVDLHVHFNEPGRTHWEGFETGTAAAAAAGITYLAEMPLNSIPSTIDVASLETKLATIKDKCYTDYGLWGGVVPGNAEELVPLAEAGVMGFKAFMSPSGNDDFENSDAVTLREAMRRIAPTGLRLAIHAEDPVVLERASGRGRRQICAYDWEISRPVESELSAVKIAVDLSLETGCPITIVHVSSVEVLTVIRNAKRQGVDIIAETCPHYLLLSRADADRIGSDAKCAPPLRSKARIAALRQALFSDLVDTLGSDHSPSSPELKDGQSFFRAWGGIAGIQHGWPLVLDRLGGFDPESIEVLQKLASENPADIIQSTSKGSIDVGKHADFALIRPLEEPAIIGVDSLLTRHPRSAYVGTALGIEMTSTWLRGEPVVTKGSLTGEPRGQFIRYKSQ